VTFSAHAVAGAGLHSLLYMAINLAVFLHRGTGFWLNRSVWWVSALSGLIVGAAPDVVDWIASVLGLADRWVIYGLMHHGWLSDWLVYIPAYGLHLWIDSMIHLYPGYNWFADFWPLEVGLWCFGLSALYMTYVSREPRR